MLLLLMDFKIGRKLDMEKNCSFLIHVEKDRNLPHNIAEK